MEDLFESQDQTKAFFITRDAKGKIRCIDTNWEKEGDGYIIHRTSYQYGGKHTSQPDIEITSGKVKRDARAQTILRFMAICKEYKDKGYKEIDKPAEEYSEKELDSKLPEFTTDANGFAKHMLAKQASKCSKNSIDKVKVWYASRKIDGVRCSFYWDGKKIVTASRGGGDYNYACQHFINNKKFIEFFKKHPKIILDGELYKHGWPLQKISGAARLEKNAVDCDQLEYYIYDVMLPNVPFKVRLRVLDAILKELNLDFNPYRIWEDYELKCQMVPQIPVHGYDNILKIHNEYVEEGWEGVVCRDPDKNYKFGSRGNEMIKFKIYKDSEFLVTDYEEGLRGVEDMVFICQTPNGKLFKAKPMGDRETKEEYVRNFSYKYKNHFATVKYFYYSDGNDEVNGVPLQPCLKAFRDSIDMS